CSLPSWLSRFRRRTFRSKVLPLPQELLTYLESDSIFLSSSAGQDDDTTSEGSWTSQGDVEEEQKEREQEEQEVEETPSENFIQFTREIQQAIDELGGVVFPKLSWSAPTDARWIATTGNLRCTRADEVLLLLKASDRLSHDLALAKSLSSPTELSLILRKWYDLHPSMEFRCFLRPDSSSPIIGISQRDPAYYDYLESLRDTLNNRIITFLQDHIIPALMGPGQEGEGMGHVVDVYHEQSSGKVWLVDINPWDPSSTLPLLFSWPDLLETSEP
ncbi:D123-domain-containing protein, partial [Piptocephalis cylindrospora]